VVVELGTPVVFQHAGIPLRSALLLFPSSFRAMDWIHAARALLACSATNVVDFRLVAARTNVSPTHLRTPGEGANCDSVESTLRREDRSG
jgi:hypothetical protein